MSKPKRIYRPEYDFFFWPYEEQTQMKHRVLASYFNVWATKLGKYSKVNFFDCHGGCGAYWSNGTPSWGSPILVAQKAAKLNKNLGREINILVSENNPENFQNLRAVIDSLNLELPPRIAEVAFEDAVKDPSFIKLYSDYPSLFFIDPFGYNLDFSVLEQIMSVSKNELLINFMFDYINRFISSPDESQKFDRLFGCGDWRDAIPLSGFERERKIVEIFKRQLKKFSKYVFPYRISVYDKNRTYYYIFHATDHIDGCNIMKSCFASYNHGKVEYLGNRSNAITLFDLEVVKNKEIENYLIRRFHGASISFSQIVHAIIEDTFYLEKDIRTALKEMRREKKITVQPVTSKRDGLGGKDIVIFAEGIT